MFAVEIYAAVRKFIFIEGNSRREAARVFGLSRDTIAKMCRYSAPPGYVRSKPPERPKLGPLVPVIDAILQSDKTAPPKQRHTAKRIFERLRIEHGYAGGYTVVKDYVRIVRTLSREVFVPLAHPPGHAQVVSSSTLRSAAARGALQVERLELAKRLKKHGFKETEASITNKLRRGSFSATWLLACLAAMQLEGIKLEDN
jgi:hypothetical protein